MQCNSILSSQKNMCMLYTYLRAWIYTFRIENREGWGYTEFVFILYLHKRFSRIFFKHFFFQIMKKIYNEYACLHWMCIMVRQSQFDFTILICTYNVSCRESNRAWYYNIVFYTFCLCCIQLLVLKSLGNGSCYKEKIIQIVENFK